MTEHPLKIDFTEVTKIMDSIKANQDLSPVRWDTNPGILLHRLSNAFVEALGKSDLAMGQTVIPDEVILAGFKESIQHAATFMEKFVADSPSALDHFYNQALRADFPKAMEAMKNAGYTDEELSFAKESPQEFARKVAKLTLFNEVISRFAGCLGAMYLHISLLANSNK